MKKDIGTSDVKAFLSVAPPAILVDLRRIIDQRLTSVAEEDARRTAMSEKISASEYEPDIEPDLNSVNDMRSQLAAMMDGPVRAEADLRSQLARQEKVEGMTLPDMSNVKAVFKYADKYGDGLVHVVDPEVRKALGIQLAKCKVEGLSFPFGYGQSNDLLKLKKFTRAEPGQNLNLSLRFAKWDFNGKSGFSCYAK